MWYRFFSLLFPVLGLLLSVSCSVAERKPLQVVFTNDSHSAVDAMNGRGGFEARAALFDSLRRVNPNTIVLDAGDMWQGSPYFNLFYGRVETEGYNLMGYDAVTLGNHEFDFGVDTLAARVREMDFPVVCANYDFGNTALAGLVKPYTVIEREGWRIGVIGVCVNPEALVLQDNWKGIKYYDPVDIVNRYASMLRGRGCNLIIVLSHLGLHADSEGGNRADDSLAASSECVDLILGGHTHQFHGVYRYADAVGDSVTVVQEKKSGLSVYSITVR